MKNANLSKDRITTLLGVLLILLGMYMLFDTYQNEGFTDWKHFAAPAGSILTGLFFVRSPDSIIKLGESAGEKAIGKKFGDGKN